jgi:hypothetical protein
VLSDLVGYCACLRDKLILLSLASIPRSDTFATVWHGDLESRPNSSWPFVTIVTIVIRRVTICYHDSHNLLWWRWSEAPTTDKSKVGSSQNNLWALNFGPVDLRKSWLGDVLLRTRESNRVRSIDWQHKRISLIWIYWFSDLRVHIRSLVGSRSFITIVTICCRHVKPLWSR